MIFCQIYNLVNVIEGNSLLFSLVLDSLEFADTNLDRSIFVRYTKKEEKESNS